MNRISNKKVIIFFVDSNEDSGGLEAALGNGGGIGKAGGMTVRSSANPPRNPPQTLPKLGSMMMERFEKNAMRAAAYVIAGISVCICATYGKMLGPGWEGWLYAAIFAAFDVIKFALPGLSESLFMAGRKGRGFLCATLFVGLAVLSATSGLGLYATLVSQTSAPVKAESHKYENAVKDQREIKAELAGLPKVLPDEVIARIEALKTNRLYDRSNGCTDAKLPDSRTLCKQFRDLEGELATAKKVAALQGRLEKANAVAGSVDWKTIEQPVNAQADVIAATLAMFGVEVDKAKVPNSLAIVIAALVELSSAILWLSRDSAKAAAAVSAPAPKARREKPARESKAASIDAAPADPFQLWLEAGTMRGARQLATHKALLSNYTDWADKAGYPPLTGAMLGRKLGDAGFERRKVNGRIAYIGLALRGDRSAIAAVR